MKPGFNNSEISILTGAGSSVKIGISTMAGMVDKFLQECPKSGAIRNALDFLLKLNIEHDLEEFLLAINDLISFSETPSFKIFKSKNLGRTKINYESLLSKFENIQQSQFELKKYLFNWIASTCFRFDRNAANEIWGELCKVLAKKNIPIFTTNYDFAIEEISESNSIKIIDNFFTKSHGRSFWYSSLEGFKEDGLKIFKLHGSVNWYITKERKNIEKININALENREGLPIERLAIFPTRFKDIYETYFFSLYKKFIDYLDETKYLFVIGHSLRDEYIRAAIREAFRKSDFHMIYIGPELPDLSDFPKEKGKLIRRIIHIPEFFENFKEELLYLISSVKIENYSSECSKLLSTSNRKYSLTMSKPPIWINPGEKLTREISIKVHAIPRVQISAKFLMVDDPFSEFDVIVKRVTKSEPVFIYGPIDNLYLLEFKIPSDIPYGKMNFIIMLKNDNGEIVYEKSYKSNVRQKD